MYTFVFSALAAGLFAFGYSQHHSPAWVWWWLGSLFVVFVIVRYFVHSRSTNHLGAAFNELLDRYTAAYGNTASGQKFLNDAPAWHEGAFAQGAELSLLTGDWADALIGAAIEVVGKFFSTTTKPAEQSALEQQLVAILREAASRKQEFTTSVAVTSMAYIASAFAAFTTLATPASFAEESSIKPAPLTFVAPSPTPAPPHLVPPPATPTPEPPPEPAPTVQAPAPVQPPVAPPLITAAEAQRLAVQRYPELGISGSKLNTEFVARYKFYQQTRPDYFRDTSWPLRLAEELTHTSQSK
jgi:hypothetical protein